MTVALGRRADIDLDAFERVAWQGEPVCLTDEARRRIADAREAFLAYVEAHEGEHIYGVTTRFGPGAHQVLTGEALERLTSRRPRPAGVSFGQPLPERVVRGAVLARLANYVEGNSGNSLHIVEAVAGMLDGRALPEVPVEGNGSAGEVNALAHLFFDMSGDVSLGLKDNSSLTNGSPFASALVADAALSARRRLALATRVLALSVEGFRAPLEHYDPALGSCWGNPHDARALAALRPCLEGAAADRRDYQAPVSFRIIPRLLGAAYQALDQTESTAGWSLTSATDNPTYLPPGSEHAPVEQYPHGRVLHSGGFHNSAAHVAMDALAGAWADLVLLADRLTAKTMDGRVSELPDGLRGEAKDDTVRYLPGALVAFGEQVRRAAGRHFLPGSGEYMASGQSDVGIPTFAAWTGEREAGEVLIKALAVLAVAAAQALDVTGRAPPPALVPLYETVRHAVPTLTSPRVLGRELPALAAAFAREIGAPVDA